MSQNIYTFKNDLRLIHETPLNKNDYSAVNLAVEFGSIHEPDNSKGCAHYIEHMCFKGNKKIKSSFDLSRLFDSMGVYTNAYTEKKFTNYILLCPNEHLLKTINLITDMIFFSHFDKTEFDKEYNVVLEENHRDEQDFREQLNTTIDNFIYDGSCYKLPIDNINYHKTKLNRDKLYNIYKQYYTPDKMILSICSSIQYSKILNHCKHNIISSFTSPHCLKYNLKLNSFVQTDYKIITKQDKLTEVAYVSFSYKTCSYFNNDIYVLNLINHIFSSGMSSRLFSNLREKHGLTYTSDSNCNYFEHSGDFSITCESNYNKLFGKNNIFDIIIKILNDFISNGVTEVEIEKILGYISGQEKISLNENRYICEYNAVNLLCNNLTYSAKNEFKEMYSKINPTHIKRVIKKYFNKYNLIVCVVSSKNINIDKISPYIDKLVQ